MPLRPNFIERQLIRAGVIPGLLMDVGVSGFQYFALIAAMEIDLFRHLKIGPATASTLAAQTGASERGLQVLLDALVPLGYLNLRGDRYSLSKASERSLPVDFLKEMAPFFKAQMRVCVEEAARAVRDAPEGGVVGWELVKSGPVGRGYQTSMRWLASQTVGDVVKKVRLPDGTRRMLDVGGSHGLYTVAWCKANPDLRGSVLDWEIGLENARQTLEENPDVADRIDLIEADFETEELPGGYDFAFLGNIIHGVTPEGNRKLFGKLARSTTERGTVAIVDQFAGARGSSFARGVAALVGFNLFLFAGGRAYPFDDVKRWLNEAGFRKVSIKNLTQPGFSLVAASKE